MLMESTVRQSLCLLCVTYSRDSGKSHNWEGATVHSRLDL